MLIIFWAGILVSRQPFICLRGVHYLAIVPDFQLNVFQSCTGSNEHIAEIPQVVNRDSLRDHIWVFLKISWRGLQCPLEKAGSAASIFSLILFFAMHLHLKYTLYFEASAGRKWLPSSLKLWQWNKTNPTKLLTTLHPTLSWWLELFLHGPSVARLLETLLALLLVYSLKPIIHCCSACECIIGFLSPMHIIGQCCRQAPSPAGPAHCLKTTGEAPTLLSERCTVILVSTIKLVIELLSSF